MATVFPNKHVYAELDDPRIDPLVERVFSNAKDATCNYPWDRVWNNTTDCKSDILNACDVIMHTYNIGCLYIEPTDPLEETLLRMEADPFVELDFSMELLDIQGGEYLMEHKLEIRDSMIDMLLTDLESDGAFIFNLYDGDSIDFDDPDQKGDSDAEG
jgi:hypothetical protein